MNHRTNDPAASPAHAEHVISTHGQYTNRIWHPSTPLFESTVSELIEGCITTDDERCGLIDSDQNLYWIDNVHDEPSHNFYMDQAEYTASIDSIFAQELEILGIFHSHPNATPWPTPRDIRGWPPFDLKWRYFIVTSTEVIEWELA